MFSNKQTQEHPEVPELAWQTSGGAVDEISSPNSMIIHSQLGTSKTAAFVLTMLSRVDPSKYYPQVLCLSPTHQMAAQTSAVAAEMAPSNGPIKIRFALHSEKEMSEKISEHIIIGTPDIVREWCTNNRVFDPKKISLLVLDEAGTMIATDRGQDLCIRIHEQLLPKCQLMFFSATYDRRVMAFVEQMVKTPSPIRLLKDKNIVPANILDLNDFCIQNILKNLGQDDLCAAIDVSHRFRQNTLAFASKFKKVSIWEKRWPKMLRCFGPFIKTIEILEEQINEILHLSRHHCRELTSLRLFDYVIDIELDMEPPMFQHVQKLKLDRVEISQSFLSSLSLWFPELKKLKIVDVKIRDCSGPEFDCFGQKFERLERFLVKGMEAPSPSLDQFLRKNPQIKRVDLHSCTDGRFIFESFAKYAAQIERISISAQRPIDGLNFASLSQLTKINSFGVGYALIIPMLKAIVERRVPIEHLTVYGWYAEYDQSGNQRFDLIYDQLADQIVGLTSKIKKLKTLKFDSTCIPSSKIVNSCKSLTELTKLTIDYNECLFSTEDLLNLIKVCDKLESFFCLCDCGDSQVLNEDVFIEIVEFVKKRRSKAKLKIVLEDDFYSTNIPKKILEMHKDSVSLAFE